MRTNLADTNQENTDTTRILRLPAGPVKLLIGGREIGVCLDRFLLTDNPNFLPTDEPMDRTAPTVTITSPTNGPSFSTTSSTVDLAGTASDDMEVTQVSWSSDRGGSGLASGTASWNVTGVPLQSGANAITVAARDAAGNTVTDTVTVNYTPPPDTTPPTVSITSPSDAQTFTNSPITVSGSASDPGSPSSGLARVEVRVNGGSWETASGTANWNRTVSLLFGANTIEARSRDNADNYSPIASVSVNLIDEVAPAVMITSPTTNSTYSTSSSSLDLRGWASDNVGVTEVLWSIHSSVQIDSGSAVGTTSWVINGIPLELGENNIVVFAYDAAGIRSVDNLAVTRTEGPVLPTPLVKLRFEGGGGTNVANSGSLGGALVRTTPTPAWSSKVPGSAGGTSSIDFGVTTGNYVVESPGVLSALAGLKHVSITLWVNVRNSTEGPGGNRLVSWINHGGHGVDLVYKSDGSVQVGINQWPDGSPARSSGGKLPVDPNAGVANWRFVAMTYDSLLSSGQVKFYFGSPTVEVSPDVARNYSRNAVGANIHRLAIGHFNSATRSSAQNRMFRGLIDEVCIFTNVLNLDQIKAVQRGGLIPAPSGPRDEEHQPSIVRIEKHEGGAVYLEVAGQPGHEYQIHGSRDLAEWSVIGEGTADEQGRFEFVDLDAGEYPCRFYRVRTP
jgi:hypothetical protein